MLRLLLTSALLLTVTMSGVSLSSSKLHNTTIKVVFDQKLPNVPGKSMRGVLVEYGPGGSNPSHRHPNTAFIYATVLEGEIKSQINGGPVRVYKKGEHWVESPGDHHQVSANASDTKPAKLLAVFVLDSTETEMVSPDK